LPGHDLDKEAYIRYVDRAYFFPACGRFIEGLLGMLCQSPPSITATGAGGGNEPDSGEGAAILKKINEWAADVTGAKCSLSALRRYLTDEIARVGRVALVVDYPVVDGAPTVRQAAKLRLMPMVSFYPAEALRLWDSEIVGGKEVLNLAVLEEVFTKRSEKDEFVIEKKKRWREWALASNPVNGGVNNARVRIWIEPDKNSDGKPVILQEYWPKFPDGSYLEELPVYIGGVNGIGAQVTPAAVDDLVDVNIAHFRNSADLEHALVLSGHPLRWVTGYDQDEEEGINALGITHDVGGSAAEGVNIGGEFPIGLDAIASRRIGVRDRPGWAVGSDRIWIIKSAQAKLGSLAASENENGALFASMASKKEDMTAIGGRILAIDKAAAEAAKTEELRRGGERSVAQMVCDAVAEILTEVIRTGARWLGFSPEQAMALAVSGRVDILQSMTPDEALAWASLWQSRVIARSDLMLIFKRGGAIGQERDGKAIDAENAVDPPEMGGTEVPGAGGPV
jgi:hypothetical protein